MKWKEKQNKEEIHKTNTISSFSKSQPHAHSTMPIPKNNFPPPTNFPVHDALLRCNFILSGLIVHRWINLYIAQLTAQLPCQNRKKIPHPTNQTHLSPFTYM